MLKRCTWQSQLSARWAPFRKPIFFFFPDWKLRSASLGKINSSSPAFTAKAPSTKGTAVTLSTPHSATGSSWVGAPTHTSSSDSFKILRIHYFVLGDCFTQRLVMCKPPPWTRSWKLPPAPQSRGQALLRLGGDFCGQGFRQSNESPAPIFLQKRCYKSKIYKKVILEAEAETKKK